MQALTQIGSYEAKTHFAELIDQVIKGQEITITRHGAPVAKLVPVNVKSSNDQRQAAILAMRAIAKRNKLGNLNIKDLINQGRK